MAQATIIKLIKQFNIDYFGDSFATRVICDCWVKHQISMNWGCLGVDEIKVHGIIPLRARG